MQLDEYQARAKGTAKELSPGMETLYYRTLGLTGEAGEVANKVKKIIRDHKGHLSQTTRHEIMDELGDVLWYVAMLADALGEDLSAVAKHNLGKLDVRYGGGPQ